MYQDDTDYQPWGMPINRLASLAVDFDRTFDEACLLGIEPKMQLSDKNDLRSPLEQAHDNDGLPEWTVRLVVSMKSFDRTRYEVIDITVTSPEKPYGAVPLGTPVTVEGLELSIMELSDGTYSVFYSAEAIRPLQPGRPAAAQ